jgi:hypothetical protein
MWELWLSEEEASLRADEAAERVLARGKSLNERRLRVNRPRKPLLAKVPQLNFHLVLTRFWLAFLLPFIVAGCTLIAPYDEVTDLGVNNLSVRTETALAEADAGRLSLDQSQAFLIDGIGAVRALKARASLKPKNDEEIQILGQLEQQFQALLDRHKPLRTSVATGLRASILDLQQIQITKKRSSTIGASLQSKPNS